MKYKCKVCKGKKIIDTGKTLLHMFCDGIIEPIIEKKKVDNLPTQEKVKNV